MFNEDLSYFEDERFKKNLALYEQMIKDGQPIYLEADELTDIAEYYSVHFEAEKASKCIDYALKLHPGSVDPLIFKARQKMIEGNIEEAKLIKDSISEKTDREVVFLNAEIMMAESVDGTEITKYLQNCLKEMKDEDYSLFSFDVAGIFSDNEYYREAFMWCNEAIRLSPDKLQYRQLKAELLIDIRKADMAEKMLNDILDTDPYRVECWERMGRVHILQLEYEKAIEDAEFALAIDENNTRAMLIKAHSLCQLKKYEEAASLYSICLDNKTANDENGMHYYYYVSCLSKSGKHEEALEILDKAEKLYDMLNRDKATIYMQRALEYHYLNNQEKEDYYIDEGYKLKEESSTMTRECFKGMILLQDHLIEEAENCFQEAIENHPDISLHTHLDIGYLFSIYGYYDKALIHLQLVEKNIPQDNEKFLSVYSYICFCYMMKGNKEKTSEYMLLAMNKHKLSLLQCMEPYLPYEISFDDIYKYVMQNWEHLMQRIKKEEELR